MVEFILLCEMNIYISLIQKKEKLFLLYSNPDFASCWLLTSNVSFHASYFWFQQLWDLASFFINWVTRLAFTTLLILTFCRWRIQAIDTVNNFSRIMLGRVDPDFDRNKYLQSPYPYHYAKGRKWQRKLERIGNSNL